jgi:ketosteroid isomerase-like protein
MSAQAVEVVERHIGDSDWAAIVRDDSAWAAKLAELEPHFEPDFEFVVHVPGTPVIGSGFKEYRDRFRDWVEPWETYTPGIEEVRELGDQVLVLGRDRGRMKDTHSEVESPKGSVLYSFSGGLITRIEYFFDRESGMRAAGVL